MENRIAYEVTVKQIELDEKGYTKYSIEIYEQKVEPPINLKELIRVVNLRPRGPIVRGDK